MATKFIQVTDYDTIYELWSAGLLHGSHGNCGTPSRHLSKEWYMQEWIRGSLSWGPYGYMAED